MSLRSLIFLAAATLAACTGLDTKKAESLAPADFKVVEVNQDYRLSVPNYMTEAKSLNDAASLEYQNVFKETYVIVIDEDKQNVIDTFLELNEYDTTKTVAENYRNIQLKMLEEGMELSNKSQPVAVKINGRDAQQVLIDARVEGVKDEIAYHLTFVEGQKNVYMIMAWTLKSRKEKYMDTFGQVAKSFKLL